MASFQEIMIAELTNSEKFTRKHLVKMYTKYNYIWIAFKTNEFIIEYKNVPRTHVLDKREKSLIDAEIEDEIKNQMHRNKIIYKAEATNIVLQRNRELMKPLYAKIYNLHKALPPEENKTHYECQCGSKVIVSHKARHLKSPLHIKCMNASVEIPEVNTLPEVNKTHFECECGARVLTCNKSKHLKSPKHLNFINKIPVKPKAESIIDCGCGKTFSLKNKSHHNKTQYHLDWIKCNEI